MRDHERDANVVGRGLRLVEKLVRFVFLGPFPLVLRLLKHTSYRGQ